MLLALEINKRSVEVLAFTIMYNQVDFPAYLEERRAVLEDIAAPAECRLGGVAQHLAGPRRMGR